MPDTPQRTEQRSEQRAEQRPSQRILRTAENRFTYDTSKRPDTVDYQWKRVSIWNNPDVEHQHNCRFNGWAPVPAKRHPELPANNEGCIVIGGQMLMERDKGLTAQDRLEDKKRAQEQIVTQLQRVGHESRQRGFDKTSIKHGEYSEIPR